MVSPHHRVSVTDNFELGNGVTQEKERITVLSWHIEGLTDLKEMEIVQYMSRFDIDICCLQHTTNHGMVWRGIRYFSKTQELYSGILPGK